MDSDVDPQWKKWKAGTWKEKLRKKFKIPYFISVEVNIYRGFPHTNFTVL